MHFRNLAATFAIFAPLLSLSVQAAPAKDHDGLATNDWTRKGHDKAFHDNQAHCRGNRCDPERDVRIQVRKAQDHGNSDHLLSARTASAPTSIHEPSIWSPDPAILNVHAVPRLAALPSAAASSAAATPTTPSRKHHDDDEHTVTITTIATIAATTIRVTETTKSIETKTVRGRKYSVWECAIGRCPDWDEKQGDSFRKAQAQRRDTTKESMGQLLDHMDSAFDQKSSEVDLGLEKRYELPDCPYKATTTTNSPTSTETKSGMERRYEKPDCPLKTEATGASSAAPTPTE